MRELGKEFKDLLSSLRDDHGPLDLKLLQDRDLITQAQAESLVAGASRWVQKTLSNPNEALSPWKLYLKSALKEVPAKQPAYQYVGFDFEEAELEVEQLNDLENENAAKDDNGDVLGGPW